MRGPRSGRPGCGAPSVARRRLAGACGGSGEAPRGASSWVGGPWTSWVPRPWMRPRPEPCPLCRAPTGRESDSRPSRSGPCLPGPWTFAPSSPSGRREQGPLEPVGSGPALARDPASGLSLRSAGRLGRIVLGTARRRVSLSRVRARRMGAGALRARQSRGLSRGTRARAPAYALIV
jgi:hypothetical protein